MRTSVLAALLSAVAATSVAAQARPGGLSGVVKDSLGQPIPNVEITDLAAARSVRSDSLGHFLLADVPSGNVDITFRRLAYAPVVLLITIPPADTTEVQVILGVVAQALLGMELNAALQHLCRQLIKLDGIAVGRRAGLLQAVGDELVAPAEAVDYAGIVWRQLVGAFESSEAFREGEPASNQRGTEIRPGVNVLRPDIDGAASFGNSIIDSAPLMQTVGVAQVLSCRRVPIFYHPPILDS